MKKSIYKTTYRFVAWLSEVTGGAAPFSGWKIALGIALLGLPATASASTGKPNTETIIQDLEPVVLCYIQTIDPELYLEPAYVAVEEMPTFRGGGLEDFRVWLQEQLIYPQEAKEKGISGQVVVSFVVERDGTLSWFEVEKSPAGGQTLVDETLRVLRQSPLWEPGKQEGQPVRVQFVLPVTFELIP